MMRGTVTALAIALLFLTQCARRATDSDRDHVPPAPVKNLIVTALSPNEAELLWTAPGDDDLRGTVTKYSIVYSTTIVFVQVDSGAIEWPHPPQPSIPGSIQKCVVTDLFPDSTYWFAVYAFDDNGNRSPLSNIVPRSKIDAVGLAITNPADGDYLADFVSITITDSGNIPLKGVWLYIDTQLFDSTASRPWRFDWKIDKLPHGSTHTLWATTKTSNGDLYSSDTLTVTIDTAKASPSLPGRFDLAEFADHHAILRWDHNRDDDFLYYCVAWSNACDHQIIDSTYIYARLDTSLLITPLLGQTEYTIVLTVGDKSGHRSSTDLSFTTLDSIPPPVAFADLCRESSFAARLTWQNPRLYDFAAYEIYRSTDCLPDASDIRVAAIGDPTITVFRDDQYDFSRDAYYYLKLMDQEGLGSIGPVIRLPACLKDNFALRFDGINDLVNIPYDPDLFRSLELTLEMWIWLDSRKPAQTFFCQQEDDMEMILTDTVFQWGMSGCVRSQYQPIFPEREWVHLALVRDYDNRSEQIYINGAFYGERNCSEWQVVRTDLFLGCRKNYTRRLKGMIDEVRIWDRALTSFEIEESRFTTRIGNPKGLVGYWTFDEGGGGASYSGIGPPAILGADDVESSDDPVWVISTVPAE